MFLDTPKHPPSLSYILIVVILTSFVNNKMNVEAMFMPTVFWDPRNPLFNCPSREINTIHVRMKDYMNFKCPSATSNLGMQNSQLNYFDYYEVGYFVVEENKKDAINCNVTGYKHFLKCDKPQTGHGMTVRISSVSGDENAPEFNYGKTYYIIGTGNGLKSGINNQVGGRCKNSESTPEKTYKMILKIKVCSWEEEFLFKNCTVCKTAGCYNKGCGLYGSWQEWHYFQNISHLSVTNCFRRRYRVCKDEYSGCDGSNIQTEKVTCPEIHVIPTYDNCTKWMKDDLKAAGFIKEHRNCTVGKIEKMTVTQWKIAHIDLTPNSQAWKSTKSQVISVSIGVFIICIVAPVLLVAIGVIIGYCYLRKRMKQNRCSYSKSEMKQIIIC